MRAIGGACVILVAVSSGCSDDVILARSVVPDGADEAGGTGGVASGGAGPTGAGGSSGSGLAAGSSGAAGATGDGGAGGSGTGGFSPATFDPAGVVVPRSPNVPHPGYQVVPDWPTLPAGSVIGDAVGVEVDSHNHVFFFHRADKGWGNQTIIDKDTVVMLDGGSGQVLATWGKGHFLVPHGLTVDEHDAVWVTDVGLNLVFHFSHDGALIDTLGAGNACGCPDAPTAFNLPTDVTVVPAGNTYVSDGYGNSRVAAFDPSGSFVTAWGSAGLEPGELRTPHGIAYDGRVYVADRTNARIQVFDPTGVLLDLWTGPEIGRPWGVAVGPNHHVFVIDGGDQIDAAPSGRALELDPQGKLVTNWGSFGNAPGEMNAGHAISVGPDGSVYVVEQVGKRIQKFVPAPPLPSRGRSRRPRALADPGGARLSGGNFFPANALPCAAMPAVVPTLSLAAHPAHAPSTVVTR